MQRLTCSIHALSMTSHPSFSLLIKYGFTVRTYASHNVIVCIP
jgi:hypothetical protein